MYGELDKVTQIKLKIYALFIFTGQSFSDL